MDEIEKNQYGQRTELIRLHEENKELRQALKQIIEIPTIQGMSVMQSISKMSAIALEALKDGDNNERD